MPRKTLVKNGYLPRLVDEQIERYLEVFGAVEVAGTKWCGKTWTALAHAQSVSYVDEELDMARADPKLMLIGDRPHVIDEWQLAPAIWNAVRHAIDDERGLRGAWLLTGLDRLSQAAIRSVTDTSPAIDVLYLLEEDAPEQSVLGLCKKLLAKLLDGADEGVHDIVMQYAHCIENHGISQGRNIWLYIFPALVCMQRLLESERELAAPFDSKLNLLNYMRDGFLQGRAGAALFEVCRKTSQALKAPPKGRQTAAEIYDQLMRHYPEPNFNISELAKLMHFHEGYLRRIFKEAYGKAPNAALRDIRMSEAKKLIDAGELQIQQIARRVGFEDASYFSKCYKSYFGYPPSDRMGLGYTQGQK